MECRYGEPSVGDGVLDVPPVGGRCPHRPARVIPSQCSHWRGNPFPLCGVVRAPRPTSCAVTLHRGRRPDVPFRAVLFCLVGADDSVRPNSAAALSLRGAKHRGNPFPFHKSPPKSQQFPAEFCAPIQNMEISLETVAQGAEECYILTVNRIRAAPMGAGFFSYLYIFRKRITGRLRNKF